MRWPEFGDPLRAIAEWQNHAFIFRQWKKFPETGMLRSVSFHIHRGVVEKASSAGHAANVSWSEIYHEMNPPSSFLIRAGRAARQVITIFVGVTFFNSSGTCKGFPWEKTRFRKSARNGMRMVRRQRCF